MTDTQTGTREVKDKQEQVEQTGNAGESGDGASQGGKAYSQDELNRMFAERAKQAESALLKKLGFESVSDAESLVKESKERKEAEMSELQKAQERAKELEKQLAASAELQKNMATLADITAKAAKLGIVDPDAAFKLLDKGAIEYDDDGKPKNTEALLVAMLKERPYLAGTGSSAMNPGKSRTYTKDEIEKMSPEDINKNWDAIKSFLERSGK
ncbi:MAG TPA: hypothetical protein PLP17_13360 [Oligoflexia bacterium]|nr:hypothetical protein [Chloroflexota bacterium]HNY84541.1 hypothetical protein [Anaerolineaceae bacterium]HQH28380.1 hypothetical protein [Oligoflexia bacterium]